MCFYGNTLNQHQDLNLGSWCHNLSFTLVCWINFSADTKIIYTHGDQTELKLGWGSWEKTKCVSLSTSRCKCVCVCECVGMSICAHVCCCFEGKETNHYDTHSVFTIKESLTCGHTAKEGLSQDIWVKVSFLFHQSEFHAPWICLHFFLAAAAAAAESRQ